MANRDLWKKKKDKNIWSLGKELTIVIGKFPAGWVFTANTKPKSSVKIFTTKKKALEYARAYMNRN